MELKISDLSNIYSVDAVKSNNGRWKNLYIFLCGLFSEYAIHHLGIRDGTLFRYIKSFFEGMVAPIELLNKLKENEGISPLFNKIDLKDRDTENYNTIINSITWSFDSTHNNYVIFGNEITVPSAYLKCHNEGADYYFMLYTRIDEESKYECISCGIDSCHLEIESEEKKEFGETGKQVSESINKTVSKMSKDDFYKLTNDLSLTDEDQRNAISAGLERNLLIIAGAGSGKTRSLVGRYCYLNVVEKIDLNRIVLLTFTRKATRSMKKAAQDQLNEIHLRTNDDSCDKSHVNAYTFDSFFKRIIDNEWVSLGFSDKPNYSPTDIQKRYSVLKEVIYSNHMEYMLRNDDGHSVEIEVLEKQLENYANGMLVNITGIDYLLPAFVDKQIENCEILGFVYAAYIIKKALENGKESQLYNRICSLYSCVLIDEFQDINTLQNDIMSVFYDSNIHFTFVGDDDQSIYRWRGADCKIIKDLSKNENIDTVYLTVNYRNNPNIVNAGNDILKSIDDRAKTDVVIKPHKVSGSKIHITKCDYKFSNLAHEVAKLYSMRKDDEKICIIYRKNDGPRIKSALTNEHPRIPFVEYSPSVDLQLSKGYSIFKSIVEVLNDYHKKDNLESLKELMPLEKMDITNRYLMKVLRGDILVDESMVNKDPQYLQLFKLSRLSSAVNMRTSYTNSFTDLVSNYNREYSLLEENNSAMDRQVSDETLSQLYIYVDKYNWPYPLNKRVLSNIFIGFEEVFMNNNANIQESKEKDGVVISTIHKAKGLEFNTVFFVGLNNGEFPDNKRISDDYNKACKELEELKKSEIKLNELRKAVNDNTIDEMIEECEDEFFTGEIKQYLNGMKESLEENRNSIKKLIQTGIEAFQDAYFYNPGMYEYQVKSKKTDLNKEYKSLSEQFDELDDNSLGYEEDSEEYLENEQKKADIDNKRKTISKEIADLDNSLEIFRKKISHIINFYDVCQKADSYLEDNKRLVEKDATKELLMKEKLDKEREEKRLFYVGVSRAIDNLYLCSTIGKDPSIFINQINPKYCDNYVMKSIDEEREEDRLFRFVDEARTLLNRDKVETEKADKVIDEIIDRCDKTYLDNYVSEFIVENPIYSNVPEKSKYYLIKAIQLIALEEKISLDFHIGVIFCLERFIELYLKYHVGEEAQPLYLEDDSAKTIGQDIIGVLDDKCVIRKTPYIGYFTDLLSKVSKNNKLNNCKNLIVEIYVVCCYDLEDGAPSWHLRELKDPDEFLYSAFDLINMRNEMVHSDDDPWLNDYVPYAFDCVKKIIQNINPKLVVDKGPDDEFGNKPDNDPHTIDSGSAGNISWVHLSDGTLKIDGEGPLERDAVKNHIWDGQFVNRIVIGDGITSIGPNLFSDHDLIKEVIIPKTVIIIGEKSFKNCSSLEIIQFHEGLRKIGSWSFQDCSSLKSISLPNSLLEIGAGAFKKCTSLYSVVIGKKTSVGMNAFKDCSSLCQLSGYEGEKYNI